MRNESGTSWMAHGPLAWDGEQTKGSDARKVSAGLGLWNVKLSFNSSTARVAEQRDRVRIALRSDRTLLARIRFVAGGIAAYHHSKRPLVSGMIILRSATQSCVRPHRWCERLPKEVTVDRSTRAHREDSSSE